jgi:hypothetical protein
MNNILNLPMQFISSIKWLILKIFFSTLGAIGLLFSITAPPILIAVLPFGLAVALCFFITQESLEKKNYIYWMCLIFNSISFLILVFAALFWLWAMFGLGAPNEITYTVLLLLILAAGFNIFVVFNLVNNSWAQHNDFTQNTTGSANLSETKSATDKIINEEEQHPVENKNPPATKNNSLNIYIIIGICFIFVILFSISARKKSDDIVYVVRNGDLEKVKKLFSKDACNIHVKSSYVKNEHFDLTLLDVAAAEGHFDVVKYLFENCKGIGWALELAAENGHLDIVKYLIEKSREQSREREEARPFKEIAGTNYSAEMLKEHPKAAEMKQRAMEIRKRWEEQLLRKSEKNRKIIMSVE